MYWCSGMDQKFEEPGERGREPQDLEQNEKGRRKINDSRVQ